MTGTRTRADIPDIDGAFAVRRTLLSMTILIWILVTGVDEDGEFKSTFEIEFHEVFEFEQQLGSASVLWDTLMCSVAIAM